MTDTTTRDITIQGVVFSVAQPYAAGTVELTEAEANALNQTRAENIRNNFAGKVKAAREDAVKDATPEGVEPDLSAEALKAVELSDSVLASLAEDLANYDAEYIFTMASAGGGRAPVDPIAKEALSLAKAAVTGKLKAAGTTVKAYTETEEGQAKYDNAVATLAAHPEYLKAAKKNVAEREKLANAGIEDLGL